MNTEYCLIYRDKGSKDNFAPAPYTIGWTYDECAKQLLKYREIAEDYEWEIGIREVSPWRICKPAQKPETPMLPGLEIVNDK